eukprot:scaffold77013_cov39-Tisochrysis_lutea.AAC.4
MKGRHDLRGAGRCEQCSSMCPSRLAFYLFLAIMSESKPQSLANLSSMHVDFTRDIMHWKGLVISSRSSSLGGVC